MSLINIIVEGITDEAVARKIISAKGHLAGISYGKKGINFIRNKISGFNNAAKGSMYLALVDFADTQTVCPPEVLSSWLPNRNPNMLFRVVVQEIESWLLADRDAISNFLKVSIDKIPLNPEVLLDPKQALVGLARSSRSSAVRSALVPEEGSTAQVGKLYASEIIDFANNNWNPEVARLNCPSLDSCLRALEAIK